LVYNVRIARGIPNRLGNTILGTRSVHVNFAISGSWPETFPFHSLCSQNEADIASECTWRFGERVGPKMHTCLQHSLYVQLRSGVAHEVSLDSERKG
jgi:hypothetical protein